MQNIKLSLPTISYNKYCTYWLYDDQNRKHLIRSKIRDKGMSNVLRLDLDELECFTIDEELSDTQPCSLWILSFIIWEGKNIIPYAIQLRKIYDVFCTIDLRFLLLDHRLPYDTFGGYF